MNEKSKVLMLTVLTTIAAIIQVWAQVYMDRPFDLWGFMAAQTGAVAVFGWWVWWEVRKP